MASMEELTLKAKIADVLEEVLEIENVIKEIPERINIELSTLNKTLKSLPEEINQSLNTIADATEEAEKTVEQLKTDTKQYITEMISSELLNAKQNINVIIKENIDRTLKNSLESASKHADDIEHKVKFLSHNIRDKNATWLNIILSITLAVLLGVFSVSTYYLYKIGTENKEQAAYWYDKYQQQSINPKANK
ncbi:TPA: hypothetical protein PXN94_004145 [Yersinia enterocolitica]|nr:hypothetical protein [Yersinia enterocolitica]